MGFDSILAKVKKSLRISVDAYDDELTDIIEAALLDMGIAGVANVDVEDRLIIRAITSYARLHLGAPGDYGDFDRLKAIYDEQKAQLSTSSAYNQEA